MKTAATVAVYLAAIVVANLVSTHFGPGASIYNAFLLIGLSLVVRDRLHDVWENGRVWKMGLLIASGSLLAYLLNADAGRIAVASFAAFATAETSDALLYHRLRYQPWLERSNTSNVLGALLDSTVFVAIAFGWLWPIIFAQVCAKIAGGYLWSLLIHHTRRERTAYAS